LPTVGRPVSYISAVEVAVEPMAREAMVCTAFLSSAMSISIMQRLFGVYALVAARGEAWLNVVVASYTPVRRMSVMRRWLVALFVSSTPVVQLRFSICTTGRAVMCAAGCSGVAPPPTMVRSRAFSWP
jgi:hypothetical protein